MSTVRAVLVTLALPLALGAGNGLAAQTGSDAALLNRIEAAIDSGHVESARSDLQQWFASREMAARRDDMVRARFLRARLSQDADFARGEYLWVAIDGRSEYGAEAWLRLAQLSLMEGDPNRAELNLDRLRADYPNSRVVPRSWLWSGLARESSGAFEAACQAWQTALREAGDGAAGQEVAEAARAAMAPCAADGLRLTVQLGAFGEASAAEAVRARAAEAGFDARTERDGPLYKVRVGTFGQADAARTMVRRLENAGFSAVILAAEGSGDE